MIGADMLVAMCPLDIEDPWTVRGRWAWLLEHLDEVIDDEICLDYDDPDEVESLLANVATVLEYCYPSAPGQGWLRDVADVVIDGRYWLFTGGMSWGDEPTASYPAVNALAQLALTYDHWDHTVS